MKVYRDNDAFINFHVEDFKDFRQMKSRLVFRIVNYEKNAEMLNELFSKLNKEFNQTFLVVTHDERLANCASKRYIMTHGKISEKVG